MDSNEVKQNEVPQFTLGSFFLLMALTAPALAYQALLLQSYREQRVFFDDEVFTVVNLIEVIWIQVAVICGLFVGIRGWWLGKPKEPEPGDWLLAVVAIPALTESVWTMAAFYFFSAEERVLPQTINSLLIALMVSYGICALLLAWGAWRLRSIPHWCAALAFLGVVQLSLAIPGWEWWEDVVSYFLFPNEHRLGYTLTWASLGAVLLAALVDLVQSHRRSWLHWLGVLTWFVSFALFITGAMGIT